MKRSTAILAVLILLIGWNSCNWNAGSYSNAEYYTLHISIDTLVTKINSFSEEHIELTTEVDNLNFYHTSFYIPTRNILLSSIINLYQKDNPKEDSTMGLYGFIEFAKTDSAKFYQIESVTKEKRKEICKLFESEILDKLGKWERK